MIRSITLSILCILAVLEATAQAPNISYPAGSYVFPVGAAISSLSPTNTGGAVGGGTNVTTLAGGGGWGWYGDGYADGTGSIAAFSSPEGVAVDGSGNVYVADWHNNRIRKITAAGVVTTFAGDGIATFVDGTGTWASFDSPRGIAIDGSGNIYVGDYDNARIRKITPAGVVTTLAGSGVWGYADGAGTVASFFRPVGVAVDASGNVYVADQGNNVIRKVTPAGMVSTLAGSGTAAFADGTGTAASFYNPEGVTVDGSGNVYVADQGNHRIRKITAAGVVTTLAGNGAAAFADGTGTAASFNVPCGVKVDAGGNVYVADLGNHRIRKVTAAGVVTTVAGNTQGYVDGQGTMASFNYPSGVTVDGSGYLYIGDESNHRIRKISPATVGGYTISPALPAGLSINVYTGDISGTPTAAIAAANYVVTATNASGSSTWTINMATVVPVITSFTPTLAGTGDTVTITGQNLFNATAVKFGDSAAASFNIINATTIKAVVAYGSTGIVTVATTGQTVTASGFIYYDPPAISYPAGNYVFPVDTIINPLIPTNTGADVGGGAYVSTFAGNGVAGYINGTGTAASFNIPSGLAVDGGNNLYVADVGNNRIRKITPKGVVTTLAGSGNWSFANGQGTAASFASPSGVAVDDTGNVYVADAVNDRIRKITSTGMVTTHAGSGGWIFSDGPSATATFWYPTNVAVDDTGNVYVADGENHAIRKISTAGMVTTLAGYGAGYANGTGMAAKFFVPSSLAVDKNGNVFVADRGNNRIRKITPAGVVTTFAGNSTAGYVNGTGTAASFSNPGGIAIDTNGNLYVGDADNHRIRKITPSRVVTTFAGTGVADYVDDVPAAASFNYPFNLAFDGKGNLYVSDVGNQRIRRIRPATPGGYTISPALQAGLSIDTITGVISGTPTIATAATNYTVTATNSTGSSTWVLNIQTVAGASVSISASDTTLCPVIPVTLTAITANSGANPTYQWRKNTVPITGATNLTYTDNTPAYGDNYDFVLTSGGQTINSNLLTISVDTAIYWTGNANNALWSDPGNWGCGSIPTANDNVMIPAGATVVVDAANAVCHNLTISPTATISFSGTAPLLHLMGSLNNDGIFNTAGGTLQIDNP